jgi:hypothetical protein
MSKHTPGPWVQFNTLTQCYETPDGTRVAAEVADNVECLADVLRIAIIRDEQRASIAKATEAA